MSSLPLGRLLLRNKELENLLTRYNKHLLFSSLTIGWPGCLSNYTISSALGQLSFSLWSAGGSLGAVGARGSCNYVWPLTNWLVYGSPHQGLSDQLHIQSFILLQATPGFFTGQQPSKRVKTTAMRSLVDKVLGLMLHCSSGRNKPNCLINGTAGICRL